ncbi:unnamed protein product, partial [Symbiodinium pilosum]
MDIMDESASAVFVLQADFDVVYSSWTEALDQLRARLVRACMGFTEQLQRISVDLEWGVARVGEQGVAVEIHRQHLLVARERLSALEAELTGVRLVLACVCALLLQLCRGVWELHFGAVPKQGLPALWSVRATAAAKSLRWRSDFTRPPSSAAAAVVSSGRTVPSSVRMARPGRFALKTWRKRRRLVARLARLRILVGEANSELEDLEHAAFFNLYSWLDTPVDAVEESEYYRRKHVEKKELARLDASPKDKKAAVRDSGLSGLAASPEKAASEKARQFEGLLDSFKQTDLEPGAATELLALLEQQTVFGPDQVQCLAEALADTAPESPRDKPTCKSKKDRRPLQDYSYVFRYCTPDLWTALQDPGLRDFKKLDLLAAHCAKLGLRCPSEFTAQVVTWYFLLYGSDHVPLHDAVAVHQQYLSVKSALQRHGRAAQIAMSMLPHLKALPPNPSDLDPAWYSHCFNKAAPAIAPFEDTDLRMNALGAPARGSNSWLRMQQRSASWAPLQ